ncbi:hypothetical protein CVT25_012417 [Psilocybe cyanescens]|uniref:Peptidase C14 caspase domain-containing protein n=1 Tax=Psilocybe cyanescens TaxID=93625 RepID=A0A409X7N6_PSICY|nr:hypothetical protein CVT25_012417 [Psilocybe cyanescens]
MPPWTPSAPFRLVHIPSFQHLFAQFIKLFRDFRLLKSDRPLSTPPFPGGLVISFRDVICRLVGTIYGIAYRTKFDRQESKKTDSPDQIDKGELANEGAARGEDNSALRSEEALPLGGQDHHTVPEIRRTVYEVPAEEDPTSINTERDHSEEKDSPGVMGEAHRMRRTGDAYSTQAVQATRRIRKRALLIGVRNNSIDPVNVSADSGPSKEHRDVRDMRSLLEDVYGYDSNDIIFLMDDCDPEHVQPTRENIVLHIGKLIEGAKETDRFFFYFAGHSEQEDTDDNEEEDGKNEFILTSDGKRIMDDVGYDTLISVV